MEQYKLVGTLEEVMLAQIARVESTHGEHKLDAVSVLLRINKEMLNTFCSEKNQAR